MSLPLEEVKKLIMQGLGTRRKEHKYKVKRSLNIQPNKTPESLIELIDPTHIVNHEEFENNTRYWCDPTVQVTMHLYYHLNVF
jgi:hypothetical protein